MLLLYFSRVHISKATLDCLEEAYDTEPGHGENRDAYLRVIKLYDHCRVVVRRK